MRVSDSPPTPSVHGQQVVRATLRTDPLLQQRAAMGSTTLRLATLAVAPSNPSPLTLWPFTEETLHQLHPQKNSWANIPGAHAFSLTTFGLLLIIDALIFVPNAMHLVGFYDSGLLVHLAVGVPTGKQLRHIPVRRLSCYEGHRQ